MRYLSLILFALFFVSKTNSQSFKEVQINSVKDTAFVNYIVKNYRTYVQRDIDSTLIFLETILEISKQQNYTLGKINSYRLIADLYSLRLNTDSALFYLNKSSFIADSINDKFSIVNILILKANITSDRGDYDASLSLYLKALKISKEINYDVGLFKCYANIGANYHYTSEYALAIEYYTKSIPFMEKLNDSIALSIISSNLAALYQVIEDYSTAKEFCTKALLYTNKEDKWGRAQAFTNLGKNFHLLKDENKAIDYYKQALELGEYIDDKVTIVNNHYNIGDSYNNLGFFRKGVNEMEIALNIAEENAMLNEIAQITCGLAQKYVKNGIYKKAKTYAARSLEVSEQIKIDNLKANAFQVYSEIEYALGNYKSSADYLKKYSAIHDSIKSQDYIDQMSKLQNKYEIEKQNQHIEMLIQDSLLNNIKLEKKDIQIKKKKTETNFLLVIGVLLLMGVVLVVYFLLQYRKVNRVVVEEKNKVENQKKIIEIKNRDITDSIQYAKRIQKVILPNDEKFNELFDKSFIYYNPKDIVAGDFYWLEKTKDATLFAVADCTGHGVPGAFVSVMCHNALNRSVRQYGKTIPGEVLDVTKSIIVQEFSSSNIEVNDGMDISLCSIDKNKILKFSGANNPLWIVRDSEIIIVKGDKQPIGNYVKDEPFKTHTIELISGDCIYIFSDGFVDQFGGDNNKKFKSSNFKKLILSVQNKPMNSQKELFSKAFESWKGSYEQMDDVCLLGVKI